MKAPKEKAKELFDKYYLTKDERGLCRINEFIAKQCALIAANDSEKLEYNVLKKFGFVTENYKSDYWQEVKKEIELL
jgi:hypothetical protein